MNQLKPASERLALRKKELEGFRAKKIFGQNFLVSDKVIHRILAEVQQFNADTIIEIGPGLGALTDGLSLMSKPLHLIELDQDLIEYWKSKNFQVIEGDALKMDWEAQAWVKPVCLVSNLPYQISSRLVIDRSLDSKPLDFMVLMFQKEVAQKILAEPPSSEVGLLTVVAQTFWRVRSVVKASPHDFRPAPKISSQVVAFRPKIELSDPAGFLTERKIKQEYLSFLKAAFASPRKLLSSNLKAGLSHCFPHDSQAALIQGAFQKLQISENIRAHQMPMSLWKDLYLCLKNQKKDKL